MKLSSHENLDVTLVNKEGQVVKTLDMHLREWLIKRNISPDFYIEDEVKELILTSLQDENLESCFIDEEGGLVMEFKEDEPSTIQPKN